MKKLMLTASVAVMMCASPAFAADAMAPATTTTTTTATTTQGTTIADVAMANPELSTLVSALKAADWVEPLKGPGPFTVFAPTNAAFAALPPATLESLLKPENKSKLQNILKHHVVAGKWMAADLKEGSNDVKAENGTNLKVTKDASGVTVGGSKVTKADVSASNGVVHVIDKVIVE